jgi:hypothetical protein
VRTIVVVDGQNLYHLARAAWASGLLPLPMGSRVGRWGDEGRRLRVRALTAYVFANPVIQIGRGSVSRSANQ